MKKTILAVTILMAFNVKAGTTIETCNLLEDMAGAIMGARQRGNSMRSMIKKADNHKEAQQYVIEAFEVPIYDSKEYKKKATDRFKNKAFKECFKLVKKENKK